MFNKDQTPTKRQRALRDKKGFEPLDRRREVGLAQEPHRVVRPGWNGQFPPARQMLGDGAETGIKPRIAEQWRRLVDHRLATFGMGVERAQKPRQRVVPHALISLHAARQFGQSTGARPDMQRHQLHGQHVLGGGNKDAKAECRLVGIASNKFMVLCAVAWRLLTPI